LHCSISHARNLAQSSSFSIAAISLVGAGMYAATINPGRGWQQSRRLSNKLLQQAPKADGI
jgi:hypothetical protein